MVGMIKTLESGWQKGETKIRLEAEMKLKSLTENCKGVESSYERIQKFGLRE